ncbi:hypothetical protein [Vibrio scophthalmi]|uniref:Uncharacterized protein n=1 Tax=Vibrio scophthalmi LMG 19158 TaxID=870967 RepID=F9RKA4_9VIBR|nr:hypothetical protein [Vibrio scophthalmi]EGU40015.1 hypothetical protein VIS19158_23135 [Vibrio scophthalmi LMG 19158]
MKKVIALFCTALLSFSVFAGGAATERGPWVDCTYQDGSMDYIPSGVCKERGGVLSTNQY